MRINGEFAEAIVEKNALKAVGDPTGVEERRALIQRVAACEQFSKSARLRDFLLYVGLQSLKDDSTELHEQEIGARVFGRPESYDRSQDNIVRVNATELRRRIDFYFATDGARETLIFEIPRGGYKPVFHLRSAVGTIPHEAPVPAPQPLEGHTAGQHAVEETERRFRPRVLWHLPWGTAVALLAGVCVLLWMQNRSLKYSLHPWQSRPAVAAFWTSLLDAQRQTDIVLPDSSVSLNEEITRVPINLNDYLGRAYIDNVRLSEFGADRKDDLTRIFSHNLITFGDVRAAQRILALDPTHSSLQLTTARFFTADSIKNNNTILIGGKKANPWVYLFEDQMNFSLDQNNDSLTMFVSNRNPQAGEQTRYSEYSGKKGPVGYSIIAYLPNPSQTGRAIILTGTSSDATNAAAEFLTTEEQMDQFRKLLHVDRFPYFEVLLRTSQLSGTSFHAEIVAYRSYPSLR